MALVEMTRRKPNLKNRVAPEVEEAVVAMATEQPAWGQTRASSELKKRGIEVSESVLKLGQWLILRMSRLAIAMCVMASETSTRVS